ncbi:uncharacterized protein LOC116775080 [Danaus plexippus]|uniref:uncharacterized protein LOC116775080 n=1 Tax=Danaus plexippus TaxID=13037 RepID=UPI002AB30293|nr:uncharacterized protein LOC116775080 [Danaus plexippus]
MKIFLFILFAFAVNGAVIKTTNTTRTNLNIGFVSPNDLLLQRTYIYQPARPNAIQYQDYVYRGSYSTRISGVYVNEVGYTQYANAWILRGGIGYNNVTVRIQSARGGGYYYQIDVWGR